MSEVRLLEIMLGQLIVLGGAMVYGQWAHHRRRIDRLEKQVEALQLKDWDSRSTLRRTGTER